MTRPASTEVLLAGLTFPEGPRWRDGKLWFSDFYSKRVMTVDQGGTATTVVEVPGQPSGLGWTPQGVLLVVSMLDKRLLRYDPQAPAGNSLHTVADLSAHAGGPCNDMVVDAAGRAYVGNFGFDMLAGEERRSACLQRIDPDGGVVVAAEDLMFPNGTVITPDGSTLIVAETFGHRLTAFDIASDGGLTGGGLTKRRVFAQLEGSFPDGMCLDAEGAVWVADARGKQVLRVFEGGRIERSVSTGERNAFACMLGGEDRRTLFVCTCKGHVSAASTQTEGRIECVAVDVPGVGLP